MIGTGHKLEKIVELTSHLRQVRKAELQFGDEGELSLQKSLVLVHFVGASEVGRPSPSTAHYTPTSPAYSKTLPCQ